MWLVCLAALLVDVLVLARTGLVFCSVQDGARPGPRCAVPAHVRAGAGEGTLLLWRRRMFLPAEKCDGQSGPI